MTVFIEKRLPIVGQPWAEQGGIYCGIRLIDGEEHHVVTPVGIGHDREGQEYDEAKDAKFDEINGFIDWHTGDQEEYMLGYVNAREQFKCDGGMDSVYWTRSFHHNWPWAVDFEDGHVSGNDRGDQFRVRPFRSFIA